ncbi:glycine cleavage T C-terminal barrel domain-containing protein [Vreelandella azerica]|uniref:glycine cleavage T C-terminal barrel domain-containing protein n=1 Tax=Vreelandella azerica TaxID=2732867 RepID=UPI001F36A753|nr:glycine cleavage T C-terminal barrel domain-containing protein [Halomonas azerica]
MEADFIGKAALKRIQQEGIRRKQVGLCIDGTDPLSGPNSDFWPINCQGKTVGKVTSAVHSPRLARNIGLAMVDINYADIGTQVEVVIGGEPVQAVVAEKPFYDPKKQLAAA